MPRILIADDNPQNAELLEAHLEGTGYETVSYTHLTLPTKRIV